MKNKDSAMGAIGAIPFDVGKLDRLMEEAGIDLLLATSKHNVQYLLAAERAIFFDYMDALGVSRYLPVLIYPKGHPTRRPYVGHWLESHQRVVVAVLGAGNDHQGQRLDRRDRARRRISSVRAACRAKRIGVELAFLPMDAGKALQRAFPDSEIKDALCVLERLRARQDAGRAREAPQGVGKVTESMLEVIVITVRARPSVS